MNLTLTPEPDVLFAALTASAVRAMDTPVLTPTFRALLDRSIDVTYHQKPDSSRSTSVGIQWLHRASKDMPGFKELFGAAVKNPSDFFLRRVAYCEDVCTIACTPLLQFIPLHERQQFVRALVQTWGPYHRDWVRLATRHGCSKKSIATIIFEVLEGKNVALEIRTRYIEHLTAPRTLYKLKQNNDWLVLSQHQIKTAVHHCIEHDPTALLNTFEEQSSTPGTAYGLGTQLMALGVVSTTMRKLVWRANKVFTERGGKPHELYTGDCRTCRAAAWLLDEDDSIENLVRIVLALRHDCLIDAYLIRCSWGERAFVKAYRTRLYGLLHQDGSKLAMAIDQQFRRLLWRRGWWVGRVSENPAYPGTVSVSLLHGTEGTHRYVSRRLAPYQPKPGEQVMFYMHNPRQVGQKVVAVNFEQLIAVV